MPLSFGPDAGPPKYRHHEIIGGAPAGVLPTGQHLGETSRTPIAAYSSKYFDVIAAPADGRLPLEFESAISEPHEEGKPFHTNPANLDVDRGGESTPGGASSASVSLPSAAVLVKPNSTVVRMDESRRRHSAVSILLRNALFVSVLSDLPRILFFGWRWRGSTSLFTRAMPGWGTPPGVPR